jgi:hypothetical protein
VNPGTRIVGLDFGNHLWIVASRPFAGSVAVVNIVTHTDSCADPSCHIDVGEHGFVTRRSCVFYRKAYLNPFEPLKRAHDNGTLRLHDPLDALLLRRVQDGALASKFTARDVKAAIEATLRSD